MSNPVDESMRRLMAVTQWVIDRDTVIVLDDYIPVWMAIATTTHLDNVDKFIILVYGYGNHFILKLDWLPEISAWCKLQSEIVRLLP